MPSSPARPGRFAGQADRGPVAGGGRLPGWRSEELRTTLWLIPTLCVGVAVALFAATYALDQAVHNGHVALPQWIHTERPDEARTLLIGIAAAVITVIGVVFSVMILSLTLASQQFGPRMLRNFIRDFGTQLTLGVFVGTFVYAMLVLGSVDSDPHALFVPNISVTVSLILTFLNIVFLIWFIHHLAASIQLPEVIARIARDLRRAVDWSYPLPALAPGGSSDAGDAVATAGRTAEEVAADLEREGAIVPATRSGYLQFVGYSQLIAIAEDAGAVIRLAHRPGHFVVAGRPLATVWPPESVGRVTEAMARAHITGPHRTLAQDPVFPIDQLAEIATRALSAAINDTFTVLTCIDWLVDGLCMVSGRVLADGVYRDREGEIRLIEIGQTYARMVNRAFDKIRQAGYANYAVAIRVLDGIANIAEYTASTEQRAVLTQQADMVFRAASETSPDGRDLTDIRARYDRVIDTVDRLDTGASTHRLHRQEVRRRETRAW